MGVTLTESMAMWPASSVSGYYFGNQRKIFWTGKIKKVLITQKRSISTDKANEMVNEIGPTKGNPICNKKRIGGFIIT
jgi:5-methyltetrahydrofolate--homocysteine methyltransferase